MADHPQVDFVDQSGRLEGMAMALAPERGFNDSAQFHVHQRHEAVKSPWIAAGKVSQQERDRSRIGHLQYRESP